MFTVNSGFIGEFKTGDNINYNLDCLKALYAAQDAGSQSSFYKPITITLISVIEALLHDLIYRMQKHTKEGVKDISEQTLKDVREKTLDQLETYIAAAKKHDLLEASGSDLYDNLQNLRKVRNRIHIQNAKNQAPLNESEVFTLEGQRSAEKILEQVIKHFSQKYERLEKHTKGHVENFELPWAERLAPIESH